MEPCFVASPDQYYAGITDADYIQMVSGLDMLGIESVFGSGWSSDVGLICFILGGSSDVC